MWSCVLARMRWSVGVAALPGTGGPSLSVGKNGFGVPWGRLGWLPLLVGLATS